ncbi:VOC family protein [Phenylobacterium sp.]|uniref:VOC family protein n=1 Tax=Phenylobacterium sp. TaxID=1871053 RepID=UPI002734A1A2|nr:VOC family protein [Phenylobacterium sp.]MDP3594257.1 VOC family protein [Phenylobacterium sp.]
MLDHFGVVVSDRAAARRFYEAALAPLGLSVVEEQPEAFILARKGQPLPFIYIGSGRPTFWTDASTPSASPAHYGFSAPDRATVEDFYKAGLAAGGRDNGAPGLRRPDYYGAYLLDPDGNNIEAGVREG